MDKSEIRYTKELYDYILSVSLRESDVLRRLREETDSDPNAIMQIPPEQGQFMANTHILICDTLTTSTALR